MPNPDLTMRQRLLIAALFLLLPAAAARAAPPPLPQSEADRTTFAESVCSEIDTRATEHGLPQSFDKAEKSTSLYLPLKWPPPAIANMPHRKTDTAFVHRTNL